MAEYLHGAYGQINPVENRVSVDGPAPIVYIGTAPVHTIENGANYVNTPVLVNNIAEARKYLGYSDDWTNYTLCEAMNVHLMRKGTAPLVFINVLDPTKAAHKNATKTTVEKTPVNGAFTIASAGSVINSSIVIKTTDDTPVTKVRGTDYTVSYNMDKEIITVTELTAGALGTAALSVEYDTIKPSGVTSADVIGTTDGAGLNTGLYAIYNVYPLTGFVPAYLAAPGFSSDPDVHDVMYQVSKKINGHWDAFIFADLPLTYNSTAITLETAATFKAQHGYNHDNEKVFFPLGDGVDGNKYHLSVLNAANFQELLVDQDGIPYKTASNTDCDLIQGLYLGEANVGRVYDDKIINEKLNKNGIASAAFVGGRWAIWGAHSADYTEDDADYINVAETNKMMLFYISNDFQQRRALDVDKPTTMNDILQIVSEEQTRLDALVNIGALTYGLVTVNAEQMTTADIVNGDWSFAFNVTTTPLAKSLTAVVSWTDQGFITWFEAAA